MLTIGGGILLILIGILLGLYWSARFATPGQSEDFYWLKAIRTLEEQVRQNAKGSNAIDPDPDA
jgi:hypothetical protein